MAGQLDGKVVPACIYLASVACHPDTFLTGKILVASELIPEAG